MCRILKTDNVIIIPFVDLLRNMMGLLGNVAEVKELRCRLMQPNFIKTFKRLLESESDGIEVSAIPFMKFILC